MSSEGAPSQPPPSGSEKPQALKPAPGFSSFINKSGAGKKFGPKAVRRRPGATAPAAPVPQAPVAATSISTVESQIDALPESSALAIPDTQSTPPPILPTPDATQDAHAAAALRSDPDNTQSPITTNVLDITAIHTSKSPSPGHTPSSVTTGAASYAETEREHSRSPRSRIATPRLAEEEPDDGRSPKRQRIEELEPEAPSTQPQSLEDGVPDVQPLLLDRQSREEPVLELPVGVVVQSTAGVPGTSSENTALLSETADRAAYKAITATPSLISQNTVPRKRRVLPWKAVNHPRDEEVEGPEADTQSRPPAKYRGRRKVTTADEVEGATQEDTANVEEDEEEYHENNARPKSKLKPKPRATPRNAKRKATEAAVVGEEGSTDVIAPTKRPRKPRKKTVTIATDDQEGQAGGEEETDAPRPKKKRAPRKKKSSTNEAGTAEADGESQDIPPSQRRRAEREPTPSDAEDHQIDPGGTFMDNLASRNIRVGRLSLREKKMREINWAEVKERRREEEALVAGADARRAMEERLNEAGEARNAASQQNAAPQVQLVNGQFVLARSADSLNRDAQADADYEAMVTIQEDDLTSRVTSRSFMKNNKRFPTEFMLPGQGRRWSVEATEQFYDALQTFGTDFMMIATMFPGTTRRSIKTKFVREERENPTRIKNVLNAPRRNANWDDYLTQSGNADENFKDPETILKQLEEEGRQMRIEIEAAKEKAAEERRQRHAAGIVSDNEGEGGDKENGRKKGKKKRGPQANTGFALRPGEEIVEDDEMLDF